MGSFISIWGLWGCGITKMQYDTLDDETIRSWKWLELTGNWLHWLEENSLELLDIM